MSEGKIAAQVAHAIKNLGPTPRDCSIVVLGVSDKKFIDLRVETTLAGKTFYLQTDNGITEVDPGTETAFAWIES